MNVEDKGNIVYFHDDDGFFMGVLNREAESILPGVEFFYSYEGEINEMLLESDYSEEIAIALLCDVLKGDNKKQDITTFIECMFG